MKNKINIFLLSITILVLGSCNDERALVIAPDNFKVEVADYVKVLTDTFVVNVNEKVTFNFPDGCPDEILFYSGESGLEYRFGTRGNYQNGDSTKFESKIWVNTTVNSFDVATARDYSFVSISGLGKSSSAEFNAAPKTELMKLRSGSLVATSVKDSIRLTSTSTPLNLFVGDLNIAMVAKSADATKNMLSITALGFTVTNTEVRNYGYVKNGITVLNNKTISYPVVTNSLSTAACGQYAPDSTIAPGQSSKVLNISAYNWNMGEIGETKYIANPAINNGVVPVNFDSVKLATAYPVSVTVPGFLANRVTAGTGPSEAWLVSRPINPCSVTPDVSTIIKKVEQSSMKYYQYIYKEKGVYKASFVGCNVGTNGTSKVVHEFVILVKGSTDTL
ncbi:MAG: DUF5017 domain-containing protein [Paludibacter sp.]